MSMAMPFDGVRLPRSKCDAIALAREHHADSYRVGARAGLVRAVCSASPADHRKFVPPMGIAKPADLITTKERWNQKLSLNGCVA
jgi:hypothetical protein